jgi:putative FmdB family regulatory protein
MPLYEYRCASCGHVTEVLEKADTKSRHTCEKCGGHRMEKLFSGFAVGNKTESAGGSCPTGTCPLS